MREKKITVTEASKTLGMWRETLSVKISGKQPFYLKEALRLHEIYFPERDFTELFEDYK